LLLGAGCRSQLTDPQIEAAISLIDTFVSGLEKLAREASAK